MKESMRPPRRRFDFVIGNPPYISYNECSKQKILIFELMKQGKYKLSDIYGVNLHSTPNRRKKYSPKPNLYAFFIAFGISLLKDAGKLCYIIPQTVLVNNDFDTIRYHLSKFTTINKIITFSGKMFLGRGLRQNKPVITSSLIFVVSKDVPKILSEVEILHYNDSKDDIEECLKNISNGKKISKKKILQSKLLKNVENWNFILQGKSFLAFYEEYKRNAEDISIYYDHQLAKDKFKDNFYFDGSTNIPKKDISTQLLDEECYMIPELKSSGYRARINGYFPKNKKIKIAEGSQGLIIAKSKYKILWKYINFDKFYFLEGESILPIYQQYCITSNNGDEIKYLFSILNSSTVLMILQTLLKVRNEEKLNFLLGLTPLKQFVRIPKITEDNQFIKDEIIKKTEEMLALEDVALADLVDFSGVMIQKFDEMEVADNNLVLAKDNKEIKCKIKKDKNLVEKTIKDISGNKRLFKDKQIILSELKSLPAIDFEKQKEIKDYIDDLVFALYFNVPVKKVGLSKAREIKKECEKNKFYKLVKS